MTATAFHDQARRSRRRSTLLLGALGSGTLALVWFAGWTFGLRPAMLVPLALSVGVTTAWVAWHRADTATLRLCRARLVDRDQAPELHNLVEEMSIASGLPMPRVAIVDDPAPNAFAAGRDPQHAFIAYTTGMLQMMDREQLQGVTAHEMSHIANRDTLVMTVAVTTAGAIALLADLIGHLLWWGDDEDLGPASLAVSIASILLAPFAALALQAAVSRRRETLADATAVALTRNPAGLRRALETLAGTGTALSHPSRAAAHVWISNPLAGAGARLYDTHPPLQARIDALRAMESAGSGA